MSYLIGQGKNAQTKIQIFETELKVPQDYKQDHWYYGEGVVTLLLFPDSSCLTLQCGFTMIIPLFDEPDYAVKYKEDLENYIMRKDTDK